MKGKKSLRFGLFALLVLALGACTTPPITIGLKDVAIDLDLAGNTLGKVLLPKSPLELKDPPPGTSIASVEITGEAELENPATLSFEIYATDTDPKELGCSDAGEYYACDPETEGLEKVSQEPIAFDNNTGPVPFKLAGEKLASGINNQSLYMGAKVDGTLTVANTLYLKNMKATVRLNIGK